MAKKVETSYERPKPKRRPKQHKKKANKRDRVKTYFG